MMDKNRFFIKKILPGEKGIYGMVGEPLLLGLLASFSLQGCLVAFTGMLSVFLRQSLYQSFLSRKYSSEFIKFSLVLSGFICMALVSVIFISPNKGIFLLPLALAAPLFAVQIYADIKKFSRNLLFEIIGVVSTGSFAAAIALASGETLLFGIMMWFISSARALPTFLYVRNRVRMIHKKQTSNFPVTIVHYFALLISMGMVYLGMLPQALVFVMAFYMIRTFVGLNYPPKTSTAKKIGYSELVYGVVGMVIMGVSIGFF